MIYKKLQSISYKLDELRVFTLGLREEWKKVINVLRKAIPFYDKVNSLISLGTDIKFRKMALLDLELQDNLLDAGCGPGNMSLLALSLSHNISTLILLDPIVDFLKLAVKRIGKKSSHPILGVFEYMPFRDECINHVMKSFSLRDAISIDDALIETKRVLKLGGYLTIVDLSKPNSLLKRIIIDLWWAFIVPLIAISVLGKTGLIYKEIYRTYTRLPKVDRMMNKLSSLFKIYRSNLYMLDGVMVINAQKTEP